MLNFPIINLYRSDGFPSDRYQMYCINTMAGTMKPLCDCKAAHASERDAEFCKQAVRNAELLLATIEGIY
jgi:hypothetical protein